MTVGTVLKQAREQAGLSTAQISERTKIQLYKIEALEQDDFSRLPAGIYLDGIIRAYSREVGIHSEAMVARARIERGKRPGDVEVPFSAPIDLRRTSRPGNAQDSDVPEQDDLLGSFTTERHAPLVPAPQHVQIVEQAPWADQPIVAPPATDRPNPVIARFPAPRSTRRRGGFVVALLALFAAAFLGAYFYEAHRAVERNDTAASIPRETTEVKMATPATEPRPPAGSPAEATDALPRAASQRAAVPPAGEPPRSSRDRSAASAAPEARPGNVATSGTLPNVAGAWTLKTQVESSRYSRYAGLRLGYEIRLEQKGDRVTGSGRKITENENDIDSRGQTPLSLSGTIAGDRLTLNFVERGVRRSTRGKFVLVLDDAGRLRGRFSSTAAQSSGLVEADRVPTQ